MTQEVDKYILKNGTVLLGERMETVESVAFNFALPAGAARIQQGCCGAVNVIEDWIFRGAGDKDSRQLGDALDGLGLHRSSSVGASHLTIGATLESVNLEEALNLYASVILQSHLKNEQFELARELAVDGVLALNDEPRQKVMLLLREQFYPPPLGRSTVGDIDELKDLTAEKTRKILKESFNPSEMIFSIAGKYDFDAVCKQMETLFEKDSQKEPSQLKLSSQSNKYVHLHNDGAQVHIGVMTGIVKPEDEDYYNARMAVSVLSGGMSARLFTEVREKRGLCYAIGAQYHGLKEAAGVMCYAGTVPDSAQETLDVVISEFNRLSEGISEEEIETAKVGLKSSLIMNSESSSSRASGIISDYYLLGRVRSLDEIKEKIEQTSVDSVLSFLKNNKFKDFTVVTIGPKPVEIK